jgi:hypothetical protein
MSALRGRVVEGIDFEVRVVLDGLLDRGLLLNRHGAVLDGVVDELRDLAALRLNAVVGRRVGGCGTADDDGAGGGECGDVRVVVIFIRENPPRLWGDRASVRFSTLTT